MFESKFRIACTLRDSKIRELWQEYCDDEILLEVMKDTQTS